MSNVIKFKKGDHIVCVNDIYNGMHFPLTIGKVYIVKFAHTITTNVMVDNDLDGISFNLKAELFVSLSEYRKNVINNILM